MRDLLLFEICVDVTLIYLCYGIKFLNSIEYTIPVRICLNRRIFHRTILRNSVIGMDKEMEMRGVGAGNEEAEAELQIS